MKRLWIVVSTLVTVVLISWLWGKNILTPIKADSPPAVIEFTLPDFTIEKEGEDDIIVIPDCIYTSEVDKPYLPVVIKSFPYSPGFSIQNVTMVVRDQFKEGSGLHIPNYRFEIDRANQKFLIPDEEKQDWYPVEEYKWEVDENPDGSKNLLLTVYPFYYNRNTTDYQYIRHFQLNVEFIPTYLQIKSFQTEREVYDPDESVIFNAFFQYRNNQVMQALANVVISDYQQQTVDVLPMVDLADIEAEDNHIALEWKNEKHVVGHFQAVLEIRDYDSQLLDFKRTNLQIGRPMVKVHDFSIVPTTIQPGDTVQVNLIVQNIGKISIDGLLLMKVQGETEVKRFEKKLTALQPGVYLSIEESWATKELQKGQKYTCIGTAFYYGETAEPKVITLSTNTPPVAKIEVNPAEVQVGMELLFDASLSSDLDGQITQYHWLFGDNMESFDQKVSHKFNVAGTYSVKLIVTDNAGDTAETLKKITITAKKTEPPVEKIIIKLYIGKKTYFVNDIAKEMDTAPVILEGRTLLPIRYVAEALGAKVEWVAAEQKAVIDFKGIHIELWIGKNTAKVNNAFQLIDPSNPDVMPIIVPPGRTMLPIRFIAETLGCQVDWTQTTQEVKITYPK